MHSDQSKRSIVDALRRAWTACAAGRSAPRMAQPATRVRSVRLKRLGRRFTARGAVLAVIGGLLPPVFVLAIAVPAAQAASSCPAGGCSVTIDARDFTSQQALAHFNYVINLDNTRFVDPTTQQPKDPFPTYVTTESNSPIVREGNENRNTVQLPAGRYLISVRAVDHKMWGSYITLPDDAATNGTLTARIDLTEQSDSHPLPLGKIRVFAFEDNAWTNGAPDTEETPLQGFKIGLEEQTHSEVSVDYNNKPLCGGQCLTADDGLVTINDLGPATYFIDVHPPEGPCNDDPNSQWYQTTTIDGGLQLQAGVEEGSDGTGAPGEQLWEPPTNRTAYWFGFVCAPTPFADQGTGEITGTARNWQGWPPFDVLTLGEPVANPLVALSDSTTDRTVYIGRGDEQGNFDIQNVPAGTYNMAIWDEQLSYIMRTLPVTVAAGQTVEVRDADPTGEVGVGVSRWFGWLDGIVYKDTNNNGKYDAGVDPTIANTDMDQRWRDGSIKESTFTDATGHYEYPTAEGGALGKWIINEQGFARFSAYPGPSTHDEHTGAVTPSCAVDPPAAPANPCVPTNQGGGLLSNQLLTEGHRATVDFGKRDYPAGTPGQIVGITYFATTRNEFDARFQAHEDYEPAIPDVTVYLESLGPDGQPNTRRRRHRQQVRDGPLAAPEREPRPAAGLRRDRLQRRRHHHSQPEHRAELPRDADHRRADEGRRIRWRLRLRRLLPERLRPHGERRHLQRRIGSGGARRRAPTSPTRSCRRTPPTRVFVTPPTPPATRTSAPPRARSLVMVRDACTGQSRRRTSTSTSATSSRRPSRRHRAPETTTSSTSRH